MTREEAIDRLMWLKDVPHINDDKWIEAIDMAIEALQFAEHFDLLKEFQSLQEVVRCKDCRHRDLFSCPLAENDFQKDDDFCSWGERKEPLPQYEEWQDEFNKMCESARPKTFVADEWYRDTFGENKDEDRTD